MAEKLFLESIVNNIEMTTKGKIIVASWVGINGVSAGRAVDLAGWADKTVHVFGTFDSGTVKIMGSNDPKVLVDRAAGTLWSVKTADWEQLDDPQGNALSFTGGKVKTILENPLYIAPVVSGGDQTAGSSINVIIAARKEF